MAIVDKEIKNLAGSTQIISWEGLGFSDEGRPVDVSASVFKSVQFQGVFGSAAIQLEGSIDGHNFHALTDPQGNAIRKSSNGLETVVENVVWIRPLILGGNNDTKITASLLIKFER